MKSSKLSVCVFQWGAVANFNSIPPTLSPDRRHNDDFGLLTILALGDTASTLDWAKMAQLTSFLSGAIRSEIQFRFGFRSNSVCVCVCRNATMHRRRSSIC